MNPYQIEHLFTYRLQLAPPQIIGPVPGDVRIDFPIVGGEITGPRTAAVRAAPRFRTAHPAYVWMSRLQCISIGQATPATPEVLFDVYALK
jgi:hypothetical protein